jgi:hypothetical protein
MDSLEQRIREQAYHIWMEEGCPEGQADAHWEQARRVLSASDSSLREAVTKSRWKLCSHLV